jgi:putative zinc finger/helix-turn-helix YgiT family protein
MKCPICRGSKLHRRKGLYHFTESGLDWVYLKGVLHGHCDDCDDDVVELPNPGDLLELIAQTILTAERPIHATEIRFLRGLIGWSQENLGAALGLQRLAITRWETGKAKPDYQIDLLLRRVWLHAFLKESREEGCGILEHKDLVHLNDLIDELGKAIARMREAVAGPTPFSIDVKTKKIEAAAR